MPPSNVQSEDGKDFVAILIRVAAVWLVLRQGQQLLSIVDAIWRSDSPIAISLHLVPYALNMLVAWILWVTAEELVLSLVGGAQIAIALPKRFKSLDSRTLIQITGLGFAVSYISWLADGAASGLQVWEVIDSTGLGFESIIGFKSREYWNLWLATWVQIIFSLGLCGWLVSGCPDIIPAAITVFRRARTVGAYTDEDPS